MQDFADAVLLPAIEAIERGDSPEVAAERAPPPKPASAPDEVGEGGQLAAELRRLADEQTRLHGLIQAQVVRVANANEKKLLERIVLLAHRRDFVKRLEAFVKAEEMALGKEEITREERKKAG